MPHYLQPRFDSRSELGKAERWRVAEVDPRSLLRAQDPVNAPASCRGPTSHLAHRFHGHLRCSSAHCLALPPAAAALESGRSRLKCLSRRGRAKLAQEGGKVPALQANRVSPSRSEVSAAAINPSVMVGDSGAHARLLTRALDDVAVSLRVSSRWWLRKAPLLRP